MNPTLEGNLPKVAGQAKDPLPRGVRCLANVYRVPAPRIKGGEGKLAGVSEENAIQADVPELDPGLRIQQLLVVGNLPVEGSVVLNAPRLLKGPPNQVVQLGVVIAGVPFKFIPKNGLEADHPHQVVTYDFHGRPNSWVDPSSKARDEQGEDLHILHLLVRRRLTNLRNRAPSFDVGPDGDESEKDVPEGQEGPNGKVEPGVDTEKRHKQS